MRYNYSYSYSLSNFTFCRSSTYYKSPRDDTNCSAEISCPSLGSYCIVSLSRRFWSYQHSKIRPWHEHNRTRMQIKSYGFGHTKRSILAQRSIQQKWAPSSGHYCYRASKPSNCVSNYAATRRKVLLWRGSFNLWDTRTSACWWVRIAMYACTRTVLSGAVYQ